jgi:hypothetical protein
MVGFPYDHLDGWRGPYPPEVLASQFEKLAAGWSGGVDQLADVIRRIDGSHRAAATSDLRLARAAHAHFASVANQIRFVLARDALGNANLADGERSRLRAQMVAILDSEIELARRLEQLAREDSRIGFEASNHYFYTPLDLVEKVINCRWLREMYTP